MRYYDTTTSIPHEVIVRDVARGRRGCHGGSGSPGKLGPAPMARRCASPRRRRARRPSFVTMAETNAKHTLMRYKVRTNYDDKRINNALLQLESALALDEPPMRIECFDISTIHGSYTVASMVVFTERQARQEPVPPLQDQDAARRGERLPVHAGGDAAAAMRPSAWPTSASAASPTSSFSTAASRSCRRRSRCSSEMGIDDIAMCGLAKRDEELFVPWQDTGPVVLPSRLGVAVPREAGPRRGPPLRHHLPPRAARQGHDGLHPRRRDGHWGRCARRRC